MKKNSGVQKYNLYLVYYGYYLVWLPMKYFNLSLNHFNYTFCYMHCPSNIKDIKEIKEYAGQRLADHYSKRSGQKHEAKALEIEKVEQKKGR